MTPTERVLSRLPGHKRNGSGWRARCPAHDDRNASLSVSEGQDGRALVHCHAGCSTEAVLAAAGLKMADLGPDAASPGGDGGRSARRFGTAQDALGWLGRQFGPRSGLWTYRDSAGEVLGYVARYESPEGKTLRPVSPDGRGGWGIGAMAAPRPLYRLPELDGAAGVVVVEGEKCADAARALGLVATTSPGGSNGPHRADWAPLAGAETVILPDNDAAGRRYARTVAKLLRKLTPPASVRIVELPGLPVGGDVVEFIEARREAGVEDGAIRAEIERLADEVEAVAAKPEPVIASKSRGTDARDFPLSEAGNAARFVHLYRDQLRFDATGKTWLRYDYDRGCWRPDDEGHVVQLAKAMVARMYQEVERTHHDGQRRALAKWAARSDTLRSYRTCLEIAKTERGVPIRREDLDIDPWLFNVANGTLDLRSGALRRHDPADLLSLASPVAYDPAAECPTFATFLDRVFAGDAATIGYVQRLAGYAMTGLTNEQTLSVWFGTGANGKSTLKEALLAVWGTYGGVAPRGLLLAKAHDGHPAELAYLRGRRLVFCEETPDGCRLAEPILKTLTGGDSINARALYANPFVFSPTHKLVLATNHLPVVEGHGPAVWRRLAVLPFGQFIAPSERDRRLLTKLVSEAPGILRWCVEGCLAWQQARGLCPPPAVVEASRAYRARMDSFTEFVNAEVELAPDAWTACKQFDEAYASYCASYGGRRASPRAYAARLRTLGAEPAKRGGVRGWLGVRLTAESSPTETRTAARPEALFD